MSGDKGYSDPRIRQWLRTRGTNAVIPQRDDQRERQRRRPLKFDKQAYRRRCVIEQCIGWLKGCRRIGARFES